MDRWISVSEAPEIGKDFFISNKDDEWISIGYLHDDGDWYNTYDHKCPCYPTHYQPLPPLIK